MAATQEEKNAHKTMRRGTRACRECRRRKVKCIYDDGRDDICQECIAHSRECVKQGTVRSGPSGQSTSVKIQVARLESAVQKLAREKANIERTGGFTGDSSTPASAATYEQKDFEFLEQQLKKRSPIFSLFNNDTLHENGVHESYSTEMKSSLLFPDPSLSDREKLLSTIANVPNIFDVLHFASDWWISWREQHFTLRKTAGRNSLRDFVQMKLNEDSCVSVAMGLLAIAMALGQLRSGIDDLSFNLPVPGNHIMNYILAAVDQIVCESPIYHENSDVILLFMMRAKHHTENNQLRKAWLRIRQAIHCGQAIGFGANNTIDGALSEEQAEQQRFIAAIFEIDHLMSMVLGFPYARDAAFTDARAFSVLLNHAINDESLKMRALRRVVAVMAGHVNDRNASGDILDEITESSQQTLEIVAGQMPEGWWNMLERPLSGVAQHRYESIMVQLWFWTVQSYLHMPYLIEPRDTAAGKRYRQLCLDGTRNLIRAFNYLRSEPSVSVYMCNCDDFQGLLGACILLVGVLQDAATTAETDGPYSPTQSQHGDVDADLALIEELKDIFRYRMHEQGGGISKQGLQVLEELTSFIYEDSDQGNGSSQSQLVLPGIGINVNKLKKTIMLPYFGTINIELTKKLPKRNTLSYSTGHNLATPPQSSDGRFPDHPPVHEPGFYIPDFHGQDNTTDFGNTLTLEPAPNLTTTYSPDNEMNLLCGNNVAVCAQLGCGLEPIAWDTWENFMFDQELAQDWNPGLQCTSNALLSCQ